MKVLLDPAHGVEVKGKRSPDQSLMEWEWSREMIGKIEKRLEELGIDSERTWYEDNEPGLNKRCRIANKIAKESKTKCILISFHINAAGMGKDWMNARGWSVFVSPNASNNSKKLAISLAKSAEELDLKVRKPDHNYYYWTASLAICKYTTMPAVLVENLFMDNKEDMEYLKSDEGKNTLTEVVIKGICNYLDYNYDR